MVNHCKKRDGETQKKDYVELEKLHVAYLIYNIRGFLIQDDG